jgi:ABC-2 type transport system permease protein
LEEQGAVQLLRADRSEAGAQYADQKAPVWLVIPAGFEQSLLASDESQAGSAALSLKKRPNSTSADGAERAVLAAVSAVNRPLAVARNSVNEAQSARPFETDADRQAYFSASFTAAQKLLDEAPDRVSITRPAVKTENRYDQGTQAATGQLVIWVFIPLVGISGILVYERNSRTLQRLVISPTGKAVFLLGTISGQLAAALVQMVILIGFSVYGMKIQWGSSVAGLAVMMFAFGLASAALGVTLGTFIQSEKQASNLSIMIGMVLALLGGAMWPMELFPPAMRTFAQLFPTYWAMTGFNNLAMRGLGFESVLLPAAVLVGFAMLFFAVGVARFRYD